MTLISNKEYDSGIYKIIINYNNKLTKIQSDIKKLKIKQKKINELIKEFKNKLEKLDNLYFTNLKEFIQKLNLKFKIKFDNYICNDEVTGAEGVIYSLAKLFINFISINRIYMFYIIDSLKKNDQDFNTIKDREKILKLLTEENKKFKRQIIIFSATSESLEYDREDKNIKTKIIERKPKSLLEEKDNEFNIWLENNIIEKLIKISS